MRIVLLLVSAACGWAAGPVNVVFVGDSFTWGYVAGSQSPNNYPALTLPLLHPGQWDGVLHNLGISGVAMGPKTTTGTMLQRAAAEVDPLKVDGKLNVLVVEGGGVDINVGGGGPTVYGYWLQYYSERKTAGWDVVIATTIVSGQQFASSACQNEAQRNGGLFANVTATYVTPTCNCPGSNAAGFCGVSTGYFGANGSLRGNHGSADLFLDVDSFPEFFNPYDLTWRQADGHWLDALNAVMAAKVAAVINGLAGVGAAVSAGTGRSGLVVIK